ncbi:MAG: 50S ribosomal protein L29 [Candidatus Omnitrophica bacterium]|nr:50S ribosomal protein L29 [Candidatus Omnitrophota bacterium]
MKRDEKKNIKDLSLVDLEGKVQAAKIELFNLRQQHRLGQLKQTSLLKLKRKEIALYLTLIREKNRGVNGGQNGSVASRK